MIPVHPNPGPDKGPIIGFSIGIVVFVLLPATTGWILFRRYKKRKQGELAANNVVQLARRVELDNEGAADILEEERRERLRPLEVRYEFWSSTAVGRSAVRCRDPMLARYLCMPGKDVFEGGSASSRVGPPKVEFDVRGLGVPFPHPPPSPVRCSGVSLSTKLIPIRFGTHVRNFEFPSHSHFPSFNYKPPPMVVVYPLQTVTQNHLTGDRTTDPPPAPNLKPPSRLPRVCRLSLQYLLLPSSPSPS